MHEWIDCDGCVVFQSSFMMKTMGKSDHSHPLLHAPFIVLHKMQRSVSVVFDSNASPNDALPVSKTLFPVDLMRNGKERIVDGCHLCVVSLCNSSDLVL